MTTFALREPCRPNPWRNPPAQLHQSTDNDCLIDVRDNESARRNVMIEIQVNQSQPEIFVRPSMVDELTNRVVGIVFGRGGPKGSCWKTLGPYSSNTRASLTAPATNVSGEGQSGPKENDN